MTEPRIIVVIATILVVIATIFWGVSVFLECRAHRKRMDYLDD